VTFEHSLVNNGVKDQGHFIEVEMTNYLTVLRGVVCVLTYEENHRLKALKQPPLNTQTRTAHITKWMTKKKDFLESSMGAKDDNHDFLS
jgi:hypothetical protein